MYRLCNYILTAWQEIWPNVKSALKKNTYKIAKEHNSHRVELVVDKLMGRTTSLQRVCVCFFFGLFLFISVCSSRLFFSFLFFQIFRGSSGRPPPPSTPFCSPKDSDMKNSLDPLFFLPIVHNKEMVCVYWYSLTSTIEMECSSVHVDRPVIMTCMHRDEQE